jgi:hypothetical protein
MGFLLPQVRWVRGLVIAGCLFSLVEACGGRSDTEDYLFGPDGTITQGASASVGGKGVGGTRAGTGGNNIGADGGNSFGAVSGVGGTGFATGGTSAVGGSVSVGGTIGVGGTISVGGVGVAGTGVGGAVTAGAGGMPSGPPITCGAQTCDANKQICCAGFGGFSCLAKNKTCNGATLGCTNSDDCSGAQVCCISITGDADAASSCKTRCDNMSGGRDRELCQVDADCQPPARFCTPTVFGVSICTRRP